ncbi:hypothetical protein GCM10027043_08250 [Ferruginibacter profundus]
MGSRALNYYWIGGTGNWTDLNHWATSSGGAVLHTQIPTALDNVFFDANSFAAAGQVVTLNSATSLVNNMNWTGATNTPTLAGPTANLLKIYGSLTLIPAMNFTYSGAVSFEATGAGQTINQAGKNFSNTVSFNGAGGSWTLLAAFSCLSGIVLNSGSLNCNNQPVSASQFTSTSGTARTLNMTSSVFTFTNPACWNVSPSAGLTLNSGTSTINVSASNAGFAGGNLTYYDLNLNAGGNISDNNSFHNVSFAADGSVFNDNNFNQLTFAKNGSLIGNNSFTDLVLTAGYNYILKDGMTQTISGTLTANGNCGAMTTLNSSAPGSQATISHPPGTVTVSFIVLKDMNVTGGAAFTANNAVDLGNNTGWTLNVSAPKNLYWIGNAGNWNDGNHWSLTSGGAASGCAPAPADNVFFDANSFTLPAQATTINIPTAYCNNMDWSAATNNPVLNGSASNQLKIYGSLAFTGNMTQSFAGPVSFEAVTPGQTITSAGKAFNDIVNFNGVGGLWTLQDAFTCSNVISLNSGTLNTSSNTVNAAAIYSLTGGSKTLNMGASVFNLNGGTCWYVSGLTLNCGTSVINALAANATFNGGGLTYYDLNFNGSGNISFDNAFHNVNFLSDGVINNSNTFNNVVFSKKATIYNNNVFNNLVLTPGYTYTLREGKTQTVNNILTATGNCGALITINSLLAGSQATISHPPGAVTISFAALQDINTAGGAVFTANNSINLGNNTGWTINAATPRNLYWIGNGGNWNDGNHWSLSSGGPPSGCSPTPLDNVFFDANSFTVAAQTTFINTPTAYCRDMTWAGVANTPTLAGAVANQLKIYGSLVLSAGMNQLFQGPVSFEAAAAAQTISTAGRSFINSVSFNGTGGWTLLDALSCNNTIYLYSGTLNTNGQAVNAITFNSSTTGQRTLNMGASVFTLSGPTSWNVSIPTGLTVNSGTSVVNATGGGLSPVSFIGGGFVYYDLNFTNATATGAAIFDNNSFHNVSFASNAVLYDNNTINDAVFNKNGDLYGNNHFNNLSFTPNYTYTLKENKQQTITGRWQVQGSCTAYIILQSATPGSSSSVTKTSGTVNGYNIHLRDIAASGGAIFNAYNSVNLGGNSGWGFSTLPSLGDPAPINGPAAVCLGQTGVQYHIPPTTGAIYYTWTVPPGAIITSVQGDTIITVDFPPAATSGNVTVTAFNGCAFSNPAALAVTVGAGFVPGVSITTNTTTTCTGAMVTFTATPVNGGTAPVYQWQVNGVNAGTNSPVFSTNTLVNGDNVTVSMTSTLPCANPAAASSNSITMVVAAPQTPAVNIAAAPGNIICQGTAVSFTATAFNTGGGTVNYNFKINGSTVQNGALSTYSSTTLSNGNTITCDITISGGNCISSTSAISNTITMQVNANLTPSVSISASPAASICKGSLVSFTAVAVNGGTAPVFQWKLNGVNTGTNAAVYSSTLMANGDIITVQLSSNAACALPATVSSNAVVMSVTDPVTPAVSIVASATSVCPGTPVSFTATPVNGGTAPTYQWKVNGVNAGTNAATFTNSLFNNGDVVQVGLTSNAACATPATVLSNTIPVNIIVPLPVSVSIGATANRICQGTTVIFTATPVNNAATPFYQWKINGTSTGTNSPVYATNNLANGDKVSCDINAANTCANTVPANSNIISITVDPNPVISFNPAAPSLLAGNAVQLNAVVSGNIAAYLWTPATGLSNTAITNPVAGPAVTTTYTLQVISADNCSTSKNLQVKVFNGFYIPNSFTPDGDGQNDVFRVPPGTPFTLVSFSVFDRYGNEVFRTADINDGWNGTYRGVRSPMGTYTYIISATATGNKVQLKGTVMLLR